MRGLGSSAKSWTVGWAWCARCGPRVQLRLTSVARACLLTMPAPSCDWERRTRAVGKQAGIRLVSLTNVEAAVAAHPDRNVTAARYFGRRADCSAGCVGGFASLQEAARYPALIKWVA